MGSLFVVFIGLTATPDEVDPQIREDYYYGSTGL
ncbi:hypothetical protein EV294_10955 [Paenibacillus sp. BK033]|nr:hypothetical protein [Paenibacillus sp. BK720]TCM90978.1 hypothetical protein EV294_10955 [Paenibacillus sp. BK033]